MSVVGHLARGLVQSLEQSHSGIVNITSSSRPPHCHNGKLYSVGTDVLVVVGITCVLSMIGASLIVFSYILIPQIRTKAREILLHLSLMDFMAAAANFAGILANFDKYLSRTDLPEAKYNAINNLCIAQASFAMYGTESSVLWTICMAVYIYLRIMYEGSPVAKRACYAFYAICYGIPLIMTVWFACTDKLGYSSYGGSGWCSVILTDEKGNPTPFRAVIGNDIFIYVTIILVPLIFVSLHFHVRSQITRNSALSHGLSHSVNSMEMKLLFIPIIFILLRIWSLLFVIIEVEYGHGRPLNCTAIMFFLIMGGIGDSAQGFANAILFCVFTPKVRHHFIHLLTCCCLRGRRKETVTKPLSRSFATSTDFSDSETDSQVPTGVQVANDPTRPLLS